MIRILSSEIIFWSAWIIIPLLVEIFPAVGGFFFLVAKKFRQKSEEPLKYHPYITVIIPVYNSEVSLERCIDSVALSDYGNGFINIFAVDNGSTDGSFAIFQKCQMKYPELAMNWTSSAQGKSKALNKALFNSTGKYIVNIDSDGVLRNDALTNLVTRFENNPDIACMTGVILTDRKAACRTKNPFLRILQKEESAEYFQAFLAGRNFETQGDGVFTLSGAFSAFRRSVIFNTWLYNTDTICEDTHLTYQLKNILGEKTSLCENAFFSVDPIEGFQKFYTQRQRWQAGELEVAHMFDGQKKKNKKFFLADNADRLLLKDHTFAFPRLIWYFVLAALGILNYSMKTVFEAVFAIYLLYVFTGYLYWINALSFLKGFPELKKDCLRNWIFIPLMPVYNLMAFFIRFAGIINSIGRQATWKTMTPSDEGKAFAEVTAKDTVFAVRVRDILRAAAETPEGEVS